MNTHRKYRIVSVLAGAGLLLGAACSGSSDGGEVATLSAGTQDSAEPAEASARETEEQLVAYSQCLRDQGLDVADPEVDADGNLVMGRPRFGGGGGGGGTGGGGFDRDAFVKAQETCGEPPVGGFGRAGGDASAMQDTMLAFAECMRGEGFDVPDPDFSGATGGAGAGGIFGALDRDDPKVAAAMESCQSVFADAGFGGNGGGQR